MDRIGACGASAVGSIPTEGIIKEALSGELKLEDEDKLRGEIAEIDSKYGEIMEKREYLLRRLNAIKAVNNAPKD